MTIFRCSALFAILLAIAACSPTSSAPRDPNAELLAKAEEGILSQLKDPESAQFRNLLLNGQNVVCGEVNARNSFGGYSGFSAFWYDSGTGETFLFDPNQDGRGKAYDALMFEKKGCSIGSEHEGWLRTARLINESNKKVGLEPIGPDE